MAQKIVANSSDDSTIVEEVFKRILVRSPKQEELLVLDEYYHDTLEKFNSGIEDAEKLVALGEFEKLESDPAKTAALMLTAQVIYNLDETITKE